MNRKTLFVFVIIALFAFNLLPSVSFGSWTASSNYVDVENVGWWTNDQSGVDQNTHKIFYEEDLDRWYILYVVDTSGTGGHDYQMKYAYSDSGNLSAWTTGGTILGVYLRKSSFGFACPEQQAAWVYDNDNDLGHLAFGEDYTSLGTYGLYYANFTINSGTGSITFGSIKAVHDQVGGNCYPTVDICVGSTGIPMIVYAGYYDSVTRTEGWHCDSTDGYSGSWDSVYYDSGYNYGPCSIIPTGTDSCILITLDSQADNPARYYEVEFGVTSSTSGTGTALTDDVIDAVSYTTTADDVQGFSVCYNSTHGWCAYTAPSYHNYVFVFDFATMTTSDEYEFSTSPTNDYSAVVTQIDNEGFALCRDNYNQATDFSIYATEYIDPLYSGFFNSSAQDFVYENIYSSWNAYNDKGLNVANGPDADGNVLVMCARGDYVSVTWFSAEGEYPPTVSYVSNYNVTISNYEGGTNADKWLFAEWKFYDFVAVYEYSLAVDNASEYIDSCWLYVTDGFNGLTVYYDVPEDSFSIFNGTGAIALSNGSITESDTFLSVTFKIMFLGSCIDAQDVDIYMYVEGIDGDYDGWEVMQADYFNLYVHGGYNVLTTLGTAGRITGGGMFDLYAWNSSDAWVVAYYRNLQHIKIDHEIFIKGVDYQTFYLEYYVDVMTNEDGWTSCGKIRLEAESVTVGSVVNINFTVNWYDNRGIVYPINNKTVYFFHKNGAASSGESTETRFYIDMWFDTMNESTAFGMRVNAYEFPVKDSADAWLRWLSTNWGADVTNKSKDATFYVPVLDNNNNTIYAREITMMRVGHLISVQSDPSTNQIVQATAAQAILLDISPLDSVFEAINTPSLDETKMPSIPQGGWVGVISNGFAWLANIIGDQLGAGLLGALDIFVDALDSIFTVAGWSNGFSQILGWISDFLSLAIDGVDWLVSGLAVIFDFLSAGMGKAITALTSVVGVWVDMFGFAVDLIDGVYSGGVSLWNDLGGIYWLTIGAVLYPVYLLIIWDTRGFDAMLNHIKMVVDIGGAVVHLLLGVAQFVVNLVFSIIDAIPIVE